MVEKIVFSVVKDEAPFLLEWVAYQKLIGFDAVVVYSNNSTDGTDQLLSALSAEGLVEYHIHDPGTSAPQGHAAWKLRRSGRVRDGDWLMFCDADEFLNIKFGNRRLDDLIQRLENRQGILVPWRIFGDAGQPRFTGRSIDPVYCRAASDVNPDNRVVKTLFRYGPAVDFLGVHTPKMMPDYWLNGPPFATARLTEIDPALPPYKRWREQGQTATCDAGDTSYDHVQINHYFIRSRACLALKERRGVGGSSPERTRVVHEGYGKARYLKNNRNEAEDRSILDLRTGLDEMIEKMMAVPEVARIQHEILRNFRKFETDYLAGATQDD